MLPVIQSYQPPCPACKKGVMLYRFHGKSGLDYKVYPAFECKSCKILLYDMELLAENRERLEEQIYWYQKTRPL